MKKKKMRTPLLSLLLLFFSMGILLAECPPNSGPRTECLTSKEYPYKVCQDGEIVDVCTSDPNSLEGIVKTALPICIKTVLGIDADWGYRIGIMDDEWIEAYIFQLNLTFSDFIKAADKWNCICGVSGESGDCGTEITVKFTNDWRKIENPWNDLSCYNKDNECDPTDKTLYINHTNEFKHDTGRRRYIVNDDLINDGDNYRDIITVLEKTPSRSDYEIYNMVDVAIQALGGMLGLGTSGNGCGFSIMARESIFPVNESSTVPPYYGLGGPNNESNGDCDKCMFQQLYSPVATYDSSIYDYEPKTQKVYPNPGYNVISINFTLPNYTENLKIYIQNTLGSIVLVPIENGTFDAGEHTTFINVDSLPTGTYYIIIESDTYRSAKPIMVLNE
jgi:hypothetical protein